MGSLEIIDSYATMFIDQELSSQWASVGLVSFSGSLEMTSSYTINYIGRVLSGHHDVAFRNIIEEKASLYYRINIDTSFVIHSKIFNILGLRDWCSIEAFEFLSSTLKDFNHLVRSFPIQG